MPSSNSPFALRFASGPHRVSASAHTHWDPTLKGYLATERRPRAGLKEARTRFGPISDLGEALTQFGPITDPGDSMTQFGPITDSPYELPQ